MVYLFFNRSTIRTDCFCMNINVNPLDAFVCPPAVPIKIVFPSSLLNCALVMGMIPNSSSSIVYATPFKIFDIILQSIHILIILQQLLCKQCILHQRFSLGQGHHINKGCSMLLPNAKIHQCTSMQIKCILCCFNDPALEMLQQMMRIFASWDHQTKYC